MLDDRWEAGGDMSDDFKEQLHRDRVHKRAFGFRIETRSVDRCLDEDAGVSYWLQHVRKDDRNCCLAEIPLVTHDMHYIWPEMSTSIMAGHLIKKAALYIGWDISKQCVRTLIGV